MSNVVLPYWEHCGSKKPVYINGEEGKYLVDEIYSKSFKKNHRGHDASLPVYTLRKIDEETHSLETGYFIGVDWIVKNKKALYVAPKLNVDAIEVDYIKMLFSSLKHPDVNKEISELYEIKWDEPHIEIEQKQDLLTPFLVAEYLALLSSIVKKGLKKSYYRVESNLQSRIKGKVLVSQTIKQNLVKSKRLNTVCSYEEFGYNNLENRLLNKAFQFIKRYLSRYDTLAQDPQITEAFTYISPAFINVSTEVNINEVQNVSNNSFFKEYGQAIKLGKLILKRFGYKISNSEKQKITTPPFWIDMSKLFELYVLRLLREEFNREVDFQYSADSGNELDFLLKKQGLEMVIDTKYKPIWKKSTNHDDVRQVSGYARLKSVYEALNKKDYSQTIDAMIIYPDLSEDGLDKLSKENILSKRKEEKLYNRIFKLGVKLPLVSKL